MATAQQQSRRRRQRMNRKLASANRVVPYPRAGDTEHNPGVAMATSIVSAAPRTTQLGPGAVRIINREIFGVVSRAFTAGVAPQAVSTITLVPATFNWLTKTVDQYDKYLFSKVKFTFEPILPTTSSGSVTMALETATGDNAPTTYVAVASNYNARAGPVWGKTTMEVPKPMLQTQKMFDNEATDLAGNNAFRATGVLLIATTSIALLNTSVAGSTDIGYVWADYVVDFMSPTTN